jgi:hypothetical protein
VTAREHGRERRLANTRSQRLSLFPPGASAAAHRTFTDLAFPSAAITRLQPTARMPRHRTGAGCRGFLDADVLVVTAGSRPWTGQVSPRLERRSR